MSDKSCGKIFFFTLAEWALVFAGVCYFFYSRMQDAVPTVFGTRDLLRAMNWWHGSPVMYGPELSGGGFAPGPFYYILTSIPLEFGGDWWSVMVLKYTLAAAAGVVLWTAGKRIGGSICAFWVCLLFVNSETLKFHLGMDWNAAFQIIFSCLCLYGLIVSFEKGPSQGRRTLYATFFLMSLSMQVHGSYFIFLLIFASMQAFANKLDWKRWSPRAIGIAFGFFLLPLVPYAIWMIFGDVLPFFAFERPPKMIAFDGLTDWIYWRAIDVVNNAGGGLTLKAAKDVFEVSFLRNTPLMAGIVLAIPAWLFIALKGEKSMGLWPRRLAVIFFTMFLIYLPLFVANMSQRYMYHWYATYILAAGGWTFCIFRTFWNSLAPVQIARFRKPLLAIVAAGLYVFSLQAHNEWTAGGREWRDGFVSPHSIGHWTMLGITPIAEACKIIHKETGWSAEEILRRVFLVQIDNDVDLWASCDMALRRSPSQAAEKTASPIHGYILFRRVGTQENPDLWKTWWREQPLPVEFVDALKNGDMVLEPEIIVNGAVLIPFRRLNQLALPEETGNVCYGYRTVPGEEILTALPMPEKAGSIDAPGEKALWFYINECQEGQKVCRTAVKVTGDGKDLRTSKKWRVDILGTPLSQRMSWHHQFMAMLWKNVQLIASCDGVQRKIPVAGQISNLKFYEEVLQDVYFATPFTRYVEPGCRGPLLSLTLHMDKLESFSNRSLENLNEENKEITHNFQ